MKRGDGSKLDSNIVSDFNIFYTNCNGMYNKVRELALLAETHKFKVICIAESHLKPNILDAELQINNYTLFRKDRLDRDRGGSAIYVHNSLFATVIESFDANDSLAVFLNLDCCPIILACIYRSQSLTTEENNNIINQISKLKASMASELIIVGDFNLPDVSWDYGYVNCPSDTIDVNYTTQERFIKFFVNNGLHSHIKDGTVTRRKLVDGKLQESLLDQVITSNSAIVNSVELISAVGKSDHLGIISNLKIDNDPGYIRSEKQNWSKLSDIDIIDICKDINWNFSLSEYPSIEEMWSEFYQKLNYIFEKVPRVKVKVSKTGSIITKPPWDCSALKRKRKSKDGAWRDFEECPTNTNLNIALTKQQEFDTQLSKSMIQYEKKITSNMKGNPKGFFAYVNSKKKVKQSVVSVKNSAGKLAESPKETADILADFFEDTFAEEPFGPLPKACYNEVTTEVIGDLYCDPEAVKDALLNLDISKSMGPDQVHPKVLKCLANNSDFVCALTTLYNFCYNGGKIPNLWKTAHVTPLHKKESKSTASNYRPISLTSILCKIYEKFVRTHILDHVIDYISPKQHGFVSGKSCWSNLLETMDIINDIIASGDTVDIFYMDFQKAFDTVPHHRLLTKLSNYGITGNTLNVISDFLSGRSFTVKVGDFL